MKDVLLIESRSAFGGGDFCDALALALVRAGTPVTVLLVGNGVLPARAGARNGALAEMASSGVAVLADGFSLRERGVAKLAPGVRASALDIVIDRLQDGATVLWH